MVASMMLGSVSGQSPVRRTTWSAGPNPASAPVKRASPSSSGPRCTATPASASARASASSEASALVSTTRRSIRRARRTRSTCLRIIGAAASGSSTLPGSRLDDVRACRMARITVPARRGSHPLDLQDLVGLDAAGGVHLDHVALFLADHGAGDRRGDRHLAGAHVGLVLADDLVAGLFLGVLVDHADGGAELHLVAGELRDVDDLRPRDLVLDRRDAALDPTLPLLGGVILGVLRQVAVRARLGDRGDGVRPLLGLQTLQFLVEGLVALGGHGHLVHTGVARLALLKNRFRPRARYVRGEKE